MRPPRAAESKGQQIWRQNKYFKWKKYIFRTLQILNYSAESSPINNCEFFKVHNFSYGAAIVITRSMRQET
jgi:hypothetical protein